jgi:hypothetical protein
MTTIDKQDDGMMDIGKHCTICRKLDFLPFVCPKCEESFCTNHRIEFNSHKCILEEQELKIARLNNKKIDVSKLPPSKTLFPDLEKIRNEANEKHKLEQNKKIGQRLTNTKDSSGKQLTSIEVAMLRLKKLLGNKKVSTSKSKSIFGLGKSTTSLKATNASKILEMTKLKRSAKGDLRININDRVYVWVSYTSDDDTKFDNKNAQFFSKKWPIGKMLDSSAELLKIKNLNNKTVNASLKLAMFRKVREGENINVNDDSGFIYIPTNGRVEKEIKDGDEIYILRGQR